MKQTGELTDGPVDGVAPSVRYMKRGPVDSVLRLLEQGEITRGKALEMLRDFDFTDELTENAPWDALNWAD